MKIIYKERGKCKTTQLLYSSDTTRIPIVVATVHQKIYLIDKSNQMGLNIPEPLTVSDIQRVKEENHHISTCYVDDAEFVLRTLLGIDISAITISDEESRVGYHLRNDISTKKLKDDSKFAITTKCPVCKNIGEYKQEDVHTGIKQIDKRTKCLKQYQNKEFIECTYVLCSNCGEKIVLAKV